MAQQTVRYRTYIKETIVEALRSAFDNHPDPLIDNAKVTVELPTDRAKFPAIIVRYYNRYLRSAGVGHHEWHLITPMGIEPKLYQRFKHFLYSGDVEFKVLALSSKDRDYMADAVVQTVGMADTESYTENFLTRIYFSNPTIEPYSIYHYINLGTEDFQEMGDQEAIAPWMPEDVLVYSATFRIPIMGGFYSRHFPAGPGVGKIKKVEIYPWMEGIEVEPNPNPEDPAPWLSAGGVLP